MSLHDEAMAEIEKHRARLRRKADQHWDMAGCARWDRDPTDEAYHIKKAREYEAALRDFES
jgi:hypothetical protein